MNHVRRIMGLGMVMVVGLLAGQAGATLIGDTVDFDLEVGAVSTSVLTVNSAIVGAGPESQLDAGFPNTTPRLSIDLDDASITLTSLASTLYNGDEVLTISDMDWVGTPGRIINFGLNTDFSSGLIDTNITFGDDFVRIDLGGVQNSTGQVATISLEVSHDSPPPPTNEVPEPITATLGLMGLGVLGMATRRRVA